MNEQNVKITKQLYAYRGYASTYNVEISNLVNPELQVKDAESAIKNKLRNGLYELRVFKLVTTLVLEFSTIENDDETKYSTFYLNSKAETTVNESNTSIADIFESIYITVISNIRKFVAKGLS